MERREILILGSVAALGGFAFVCPSKPTKEKAVKYIGLAIDLSEESIPLLNLLGAPEVAAIVETKVISALEKLKEALSKADIPGARSTLETVRNGITAAINALERLPESPRRTTIIATLVTVRVFLLTIEAFVDSEMTPAASPEALSAPARTTMTESINRLLKASKP